MINPYIQLNMHLGDAEPFYGEMFVYDLANDKIITEHFHFDLNTEAVLAMTDSARGIHERELHEKKGRDFISKARQAVFRISHPTPALYLHGLTRHRYVTWLELTSDYVPYYTHIKNDSWRS